MNKQGERNQQVTRPPINEMTTEAVRAWIQTTRAALQKKMERERAYLDRRAKRGIFTSTDEAYEADQVLEADLLRMLHEMEMTLQQQGSRVSS